MSGKRYEIKGIRTEELREGRSPPHHLNELVFIGRNLNAETIRAKLSQCLAS